MFSLIILLIFITFFVADILIPRCFALVALDSAYIKYYIRFAPYGGVKVTRGPVLTIPDINQLILVYEYESQ